MKIFSADDQQQQQQQTQQQQQLESMDVMPSMTASPSAPAFLTKDGQTSSPVLSKDSRRGGLQTHFAPSPLFVSFFLSFFLHWIQFEAPIVSRNLHTSAEVNIHGICTVHRHLEDFGAGHFICLSSSSFFFSFSFTLKDENHARLDFLGVVIKPLQLTATFF